MLSSCSKMKPFIESSFWGDNYCNDTDPQSTVGYTSSVTSFSNWKMHNRKVERLRKSHGWQRQCKCGENPYHSLKRHMSNCPVFRLLSTLNTSKEVDLFHPVNWLSFHLLNNVQEDNVWQIRPRFYVTALHSLHCYELFTAVSCFILQGSLLAYIIIESNANG